MLKQLGTPPLGDHFRHYRSCEALRVVRNKPSCVVRSRLGDSIGLVCGEGSYRGIVFQQQGVDRNLFRPVMSKSTHIELTRCRFLSPPHPPPSKEVGTMILAIFQM